jgi:hypothetical protein
MMSSNKRWSESKANEWYSKQPWLVGCNFIPSTAINQLEMWQADTFDPDTIERELALAESIGFNAVRTYLHDLAWEADPEGFKRRVGQFLEIASRHKIRPILVFFDDCWNKNPQIGIQPEPKRKTHNSGWVQSPGVKIVNSSSSSWGMLEKYVKDVISSFAIDERILLWDLYNEPGNRGNRSRSLPLLKSVFDWAREVNPFQPLSCGVWFENKDIVEVQLSESDIITFHNYEPAAHLKNQIASLKRQGRPLICTEWMARTRGSLVQTHLPIFDSEKVGCLNWGLVAGKTNTIYPWFITPRYLMQNFSLSKRSTEPKVWFHDLFRADGSAFDQSEIALFKKLTER